ncbi:MAG: hypothetical protein JST93_12030 [Acidobacteria bacterium]|nr:hypothetical protein [Acidobacteriota bacterium]
MLSSLIASVALLVSQETAPAGGVAQIKVHLAEPRGLGGLEVTAAFDESGFGDVLSYAVMSAAGDASSFAEMKGGRIKVKILSPSGTLGFLPGQPVLTIAVRVREDVAPGTKLVVESGGVTVGGVLSVESMSRVGNRVEVRGSGFSAQTVVEWEQAAVAEVEYVSPSLLRIHLDGDVEIRGKRLRLRDAEDAVEAFFAYPAASVGDGEWVTLPQTQSMNGSAQFTSPLQVGGVVLRNPQARPVEMGVERLNLVWNWSGERRLRLAPGESVYVERELPSSTIVVVLADAPVEMVKHFRTFAFASPVISKGTSAMSVEPRQYVLSLPQRVEEVSWTEGEALPQTRTVTLAVDSHSVPPPGEIAARLLSPAAWVSFGQPVYVNARNLTMEIRVDPRGLARGIHRATILIDAKEEPAAWEIEQGRVDVVLLVGVNPQLSTAMVVFNGAQTIGQAIPAGATPSVLSYGAAWLRVEPGSMTASPVGLAKGTYASQVLFRGPGYERLIHALLWQDGGGPMGIAAPIEFRMLEGDSAPPVYLLGIPLQVSYSVRMQGGDGGSWLRLSRVEGGVSVGVDGRGLAPGLYGAVLSIEAFGLGVQQIPVSLAVAAVLPLRSVPSRITVRGCEAAAVFLDPRRVQIYGGDVFQAEITNSGYRFYPRDCGQDSVQVAEFRAGTDTARTEIVWRMEQVMPSTGLPRIAAFQLGDAVAVLYGSGFVRRPQPDFPEVARVYLNGRRATVLEASDYRLVVAIPEEAVEEVRVELGDWWDRWYLRTSR